MKTIEDLIEKYPKIFKDYEGNPGRINWSCPEGWIVIVDVMCSLLQWDTDRNNSTGKYPQIECSQIKEKFGGLRFYTNGSTDKQDGIISMTESLSSQTCVTCGSQMNVEMTNGWMQPYCEEHFPK